MPFVLFRSARERTFGPIVFIGRIDAVDRHRFSAFSHDGRWSPMFFAGVKTDINPANADFCGRMIMISVFMRDNGNMIIREK